MYSLKVLFEPEKCCLLCFYFYLRLFTVYMYEGSEAWSPIGCLPFHLKKGQNFWCLCALHAMYCKQQFVDFSDDTISTHLPYMADMFIHSPVKPHVQMSTYMRSKYYLWGFSSVRLLSDLVVIRFFHPRHNGQWPPTSKDFYTRSYPLHFFLILILEKEPVIPFFNVEC